MNNAPGLPQWKKFSNSSQSQSQKIPRCFFYPTNLIRTAGGAHRWYTGYYMKVSKKELNILPVLRVECILGSFIEHNLY